MATPTLDAPLRDRLEQEKSPDDRLDDASSLDGVGEVYETRSRKPPRFWLVFLTMLLPAFAANLSTTILSPVMPLIVRDVHATESFIWINASFLMASAAVQPMFGQVSNVYGRRYPVLLSLATFIFGSAICGITSSFRMLIAGRIFQGVGAGGSMILTHVIVCDLLPQRLRAKYLGISLSVMSLGIALGPIIGGGFAKLGGWRWAFLMNVLIGGIGLALAVPFLRLNSPGNADWKTAFARVDVTGNAIFVASTCAALAGLVTGGHANPWSSRQVLVPIALGCLGWVLFAAHQHSPHCKEPTMPPRIFANRTAVAGYFLVFISSTLLEWIVYYLPYCIQILKVSSPLFSSIQVLAFSVFLIPSAAVGGIIMAKRGNYRPLHWTGFALLAIAAGVFSTLDSESSTAKSVFWQVIASFGVGYLHASTLPAIQSSLAERDVATSTATHAFLRSFGLVWGSTIPTVLFNNQFRSNLHLIENSFVRTSIARGDPFSEGTANVIASFTGDIKQQVLNVYSLTLRNVWYAAVELSLVGFLAVFFEKGLKLREELQTEFGLEEKMPSESKASRLA